MEGGWGGWVGRMEGGVGRRDREGRDQGREG